MPKDTTSGETRGKGDAQRERQEQIRKRVLAEGSVQVDQLAEEFSVNPMTIHRDLDALQQQGWLRKVRGGNRPAIGPVLWRYSLAYRP